MSHPTDENDAGSTYRAALVARVRAIPDGQISATARKGGLTLRQLSRIKRGDNTNITLGLLEKIAKGLGETASEVLGETPRERDGAAIDDAAARRIRRALGVAATAQERAAVQLRKAAEQLPPEADD